MPGRSEARRVRRAYEFIKAHRDEYDVRTMCRAFSKFAKLGLVDLINPHRFRAPNPARLRRLVEGRIAAYEPVLDADAMTRATIAF